MTTERGSMYALAALKAPMLIVVDYAGDPEKVPMLERILPPGFEPAMLPEPDSEGARLSRRYCVQCHNARTNNPAADPMRLDDVDMNNVAKNARQSRKRFGGALEPMTVGRARYCEREGRELVRLEEVAPVRSPLAAVEAAQKTRASSSDFRSLERVRQKVISILKTP